MLWILLLIFISVVIFVLTCCFMASAIKAEKQVPGTKRVLFVTSHPDDEVMFFGPTVLSLTKDSKFAVYMLCMSAGAPDEDKKRKKEMYDAAAILGIPKGNITLMHYTKLKDDPKLKWCEEMVSKIILHSIMTLGIDTVFTFDQYGVSGHKHHICLYKALILLSRDSDLPSNIKLFALHSVNIVRKFSSIFDVPMSQVFNRFLSVGPIFTNTVDGWVKLQSAMMTYNSQYLWYRKVWMLISRYTAVNSYSPVKLDPQEKPQEPVFDETIDDDPANETLPADGPAEQLVQ